MDKLEKHVKETLRKIKIKKNKRILVALSGGKDSAVTAYLLKKFRYNIQGFHINLGMGKYSEECLEKIKELCRLLKIKLHVYDVKKEMGSSMCYIRTGIQSRAKGQIKNCAICGVIKKWIINKQARKLKADFIATGHNLDDEAQTFLINIFKGSPKLSVNLGPISQGEIDKKFIPRIKPLFYAPEKEIKKYSLEKELPIEYKGCPCAMDSYRIQVRKFLNTLSDKKKKNIIENFEKILPRIKVNDSGVKYCEICGEPSRGRICKRCQLIKM
ncbi:TIGR00269 family protein [Candidatus Pacearchaeota archaeon]|nr:MAG: TIGR00269 family protein [Candidatus Pacearchaeota archaeon]